IDVPAAAFGQRRDAGPYGGPAQRRGTLQNDKTASGLDRYPLWPRAGVQPDPDARQPRQRGNRHPLDHELPLQEHHVALRRQAFWRVLRTDLAAACDPDRHAIQIARWLRCLSAADIAAISAPARSTAAARRSTSRTS